MTRRRTERLTTDRLVLAPLDEDDAPDMVRALLDGSWSAITGDGPAGLPGFQARYRDHATAQRAVGEMWHDWVIELGSAGGAIGVVQATVRNRVARITWMVAPAWQRRGYATEAVSAMATWLRDHGVERLTALLHPDQVASCRIAAVIGLSPSDRVDDEGRVLWASAAPTD